MRAWISLAVGMLLSVSIGCSSEKTLPRGQAEAGGGGSGGGSSRDEGARLVRRVRREALRERERLLRHSRPGSTVEACVQGMMSETCRPAADAVAAGFATYHRRQKPRASRYTRSPRDLCRGLGRTPRAQARDLGRLQGDSGDSPRPRLHDRSDLRGAGEGNGAARCVAGTCRVVEILSEGAECPYPNGDVSVCDAGLYCTTTERDRTGTCEPVVATGEDCRSGQPESGVWTRELLRSRRRGNGARRRELRGPSCAWQGTECVSFQCDAITEECEEPPATVAGALRGGPARASGRVRRGE